MTLARGSKGEEVKELQESLQSIGIYRGPIDGYYGKGTFEAVRNFQQRYLVDGIANDVTLDQIKNAVNAWKDNEETLFTVPNGLAEIQEVYGYIEYEDIDEIRWGKQAWIRVTNNWEKEYLVKANLPIVGDQIVNKNIVKSLSRVFQKIVDRGLDGKIKQFGCYAPRHQLHHRSYPLSTHAYACAVDINQDTNKLGTTGDMDPGITEAFQSFGWKWGGEFRLTDPMHYQLCHGY